jgi:hypothetical protein
MHPLESNNLILIISTCFETEGSSSGRRFYVQVWSNNYVLHGSVKNSLVSGLLIPMHVKHNIHTFLNMNPRGRNM